MNSYKQVDQMAEEWKKQGLSKEEFIIRCAEAELGWPYVWGAVGAQCTPSKREYYAGRSSCPEGEKAEIKKKCQVLNGKKQNCDGCQYYPEGVCVLIDDCQGFVKQVMSRVGISFTGGGCTSMWNNNANWSQKGKINEMPNVVCCVFYDRGGTKEHIGIHIGNGKIIHCSGTVKYGSTSEKMWTHYAIPKDMGGDTPMPTRKTIRKGSTGDDVVYCQECLIQLGYDLSPYGADGKFGAKTQTAVISFQRSHGLTPDGVVGPMTWEALEKAVGPEPEPAEKKYTVTIPHLSIEQADKLLAEYPGAEKAEEKG